MADEVRNRTKHPRAKWHRYNDGIYFVTICCYEKKHYFGKIIDGELHLNDAGKIAVEEIENLKNHHSDLSIDNYVVMPNHIHLLCEIFKNNDYDDRLKSNNVGVLHAAEFCRNDDIPFNESNHHNSPLSVTIGGLKSGITRRINKLGVSFKWQYGFHDHIVTMQCEYDYIYEYISDNVARWDKDCFKK